MPAPLINRIARGLVEAVRRALGARPDADRQGRRDPLGPAGERAAARLLKRDGYTLLGRNVRVLVGEADLVMLAPDRRTIVIVEVKTRRVGTPAAADEGPDAPAAGMQPLPPEVSIDAAKRRKLIAVARYLRRANGWHDRAVRIDVVAVEWPDRGEPRCRHHPNAVAIAS
jgi:putative endonuclease